MSPAPETSTALKFRGQNARVPKVDAAALPHHLKAVHTRLTEKIVQGDFCRKREKRSLRKRVSKFLRRKFKQPALVPTVPAKIIGNAAGKVNIGGGAGFTHEGWLNFDTVDHSVVGANITLSPETVLPVTTRSVGLIYSSHCLEHLNDATVARVLQEARRIIAPNGAMVLKIPDFERVLESHAAGNMAFFERQWGIESVTPTWRVKGIEDTITARASFVFAGYWNDGFGNPFDTSVPRGLAAYHGPAPISEAAHEEILNKGDPREISAALCREIETAEDFGGYNHQNAWNRQQLADLVEAHGFQVCSGVDEEIRLRFSDVPEIDQMYQISQYLWAAPAS